MKFFLTITFILSLSMCFSQAKIDSLYKTNGEVLLINVKEITESSIKFSYPNEDFSNTIAKSAVEKIVFKSGRTQEFSSALSILEVSSCLDWGKVQISKIESEVAGLEKIESVGAKAKGMTTLSSLVKLQDRAYNKMKMAAAMIGGNLVYILDQNTEEAISGGEYSSTKLPSVTVSGMVYTSQKVSESSIVPGKYRVDMVFELRPNNYEIKPVSLVSENVEVVDGSAQMENGYPKFMMKSKNVKKVETFTVISANENEMVLSAIWTSRGGKKTYYNVFLKRI